MLFQAFSYYGTESPFLVDELEQYFEGGMSDMATWSNRFFRKVVTMIEQGTELVSNKKIGKNIYKYSILNVERSIFIQIIIC